MLKGTFCLLDDPDLLEIFLQRYGSKIVFRGGPRVMQEHGDDTLESAVLYLVDYPGGEPPYDVRLDLTFMDDGGSFAGLIKAKVLDVSALEILEFIEDTADALDKTRSADG